MDSGFITVSNNTLRYSAFWLANAIAMNSALQVDKVTDFCFWDFHEIIRLSFDNIHLHFFGHLNEPNLHRKIFLVLGASAIF